MSGTSVTLAQVKLAGELLKREHEQRLLLEKEASDLKVEKRAMKIAFREIELGIAEPYKTHDEFMNKVASLAKEDLDVVEKALERGYGPARRGGELADEPNGKGMDPLTRWVTTGELE
jgi:methylphosphotriester-DNA--protein-cysteine methyltransferase